MGGKKDKKKKLKKAQKGAKEQDEVPNEKLKKGQEFEDIDAILHEFEQEQQQKFLTTEESNCEPPSRRVNCSFTTNPDSPDDIYLFGGEFFDGHKVHMYNDLFKYNCDKNEWKRITSPHSPGPRSSHQVVITTNGILYLWGGEFVSPSESNFFHYKDFWSMDLRAQPLQWEKISIKCPPPRSGHRMALWKNFIVMYGGFYDQIHQTKYYDDFWVFDTVEINWKRIDIPDPKPSARSGFSLFSHGEHIMLYGGYSKIAKKGQKTVGMQHVDAWMLRANTDWVHLKWEKRRKVGGMPPGSRSGCTMVTHKGRGIMFGGVADIDEDEEHIESVVFNDMFQYNLDSNKFYPLNLRKPRKSKKERELEIENLQERHNDEFTPGPRFNPAIAVSRNNIYMFGGAFEIESKEITLGDFWTLNLDKLLEWNQLLKDEEAELAWTGEKSEDEDESDDGSEEETDDDDKHSLDDKDSVNDGIPPPVSGSNDPIAGESITEYFARTTEYWQKRAYVGFERTGKVLRRRAFTMAHYHFIDMREELEQIEAVLQENEVFQQDEKITRKEYGESRSRNR